MSAREEGDDELVDESVLADDILLYLLLDSVKCIVDVGESRIHSRVNSK